MKVAFIYPFPYLVYTDACIVTAPVLFQEEIAKAREEGKALFV